MAALHDGVRKRGGCRRIVRTVRDAPAFEDPPSRPRTARFRRDPIAQPGSIATEALDATVSAAIQSERLVVQEQTASRTRERSTPFTYPRFFTHLGGVLTRTLKRDKMDYPKGL